MCKAIGCPDLEQFRITGDGQVAVLKHHGLKDGMSVYDLGCGSGRTAQALFRSGRKGHYRGADIIKRLVDYLNEKCPGYGAVVNRSLSIVAPDASLDLVFHWSVFTHLFIEECHIFMQDIFRALKPGGRMVFSFMELEAVKHRRIFFDRVEMFRAGREWGHLDTFLHRDWICRWAADIGFTAPAFTDGTDSTHHASFWQTLVAMDKPALGAVAP
jgi:SAM-dependent methyltransferase